MMRALKEIKEKLCAEIEEIAGKEEMSMGDLDLVHKLTDTVKNIEKIEMLEEAEEYRGRYSRDGEGGGGYSGRGGYSRDDRYAARYNGYDEGSSHAGRGQHYVRGHYSRDDGKRVMTEQLREMMEDADGKTRQMIQRVLKEIEEA